MNNHTTTAHEFLLILTGAGRDCIFIPYIMCVGLLVDKKKEEIRESLKVGIPMGF